MASVLEIEAERISRQEQLDLQKTSVERNRLGQFATPPALALDIAQYAWQQWESGGECVRFLDPAIGTGSFFAALLKAFPAALVERACGTELDPAFASAAMDLWKDAGLTVTPGDFTKQPSLPENSRFNLILTNPPYVRHHHIGLADKQRLRELVYREIGIRLNGLAGLYCYFLLLADKWLAADGLAIWLIPSEFMDVNYGHAVKRYLTDRVELLRIHRFRPSDVQFSDALVSSAVVVFRKRRATAEHVVEMTLGGTLQNPQTNETLALRELADSPKWTLFPHGRRNAGTNGMMTLGDLFMVKRGLATGDNGFFIVARDRARQLKIPDECLRPILPSPRHLRNSIIESDEDGYPRIERAMALIDTDLSETLIQQRFPDFGAYLAQGKQKGVHLGYLTSRRSPWYSQESRPPAPFLCTYMGRPKEHGNPFRFFWNKSRATAANVYLMLYPKANLAAVLRSRPELEGAVFDVLSGLSARSLIQEGRVYGGGLYKMEPAELGRLPAAGIMDAVGGLYVKVQKELSFCPKN